MFCMKALRDVCARFGNLDRFGRRCTRFAACVMISDSNRNKIKKTFFVAELGFVDFLHAVLFASWSSAKAELRQKVP